MRKFVRGVVKFRSFDEAQELTKPRQNPHRRSKRSSHCPLTSSKWVSKSR